MPFIVLYLWWNLGSRKRKFIKSNSLISDSSEASAVSVIGSEVCVGCISALLLQQLCASIAPRMNFPQQGRSSGKVGTPHWVMDMHAGGQPEGELAL